MQETSFINQPVDTNALPEMSALSHQSLAANYAPVNRLVNLSVTVFLCFIGMAIMYQPWIGLPNGTNNILPYVIWAVGILGLINTIFCHYSDQLKSYALRDLDLHYASGVFFRKTVSQPITRIQHIELKRGPIERKVGLATLQVFSAGGEMHTFQIPGLKVETAEQLRQFILQHKELVKHG